MNRKHMLALVFSLTAALLVSVPVQAQQERDAIEVIRAQIATNRQALIAENMELTAEESDKFWPVYREYQNARAPLIDRRIALLSDFRDNFEFLTDEKANQLLDESLKIEQDTLKLKKKHLRQFNKVLPAKKVARYYQIENKIDTIIDFDLAQIVPLAE